MNIILEESTPGTKDGLVGAEVPGEPQPAPITLPNITESPAPVPSAPTSPVRPTESEYDTDLDRDSDSPAYDISGKNLYLSSCEKLGVVPSKYFQRHMQEEHLQMTHHGLGPNGTIAICFPLQANTFITDLELADNFMEADGVAAVCWMLQENVYVTHLDLSGNLLGSRGARFVAKMLSQNITLIALNLSDNGFEDADGVLLAEPLAENKSLVTYNLSKNTLGSLSATAICQSITDNDFLQDLDISWNFIRYKTSTPVCKMLKNNETLVTLNLSNLGLAREGAKVLGDALVDNIGLRKLYINSCRLGADGAGFIAKALTLNMSLLVLEMADNNIGIPAATLLVTSIGKNKASALTRLDLGKMEVSKLYVEAETRLAETNSVVIKRGKILSDFEIKGIYVKERRMFGLTVSEFDSTPPLLALRDFASAHQIDAYAEYVDHLFKNGITTVHKDEVIELAKGPEFLLSAAQQSKFERRITDDANSSSIIDVSLFLQPKA